MSIQCKRICGYCRRVMKEGNGDERIKHKTRCSFEQKLKRDEGSGLMVNSIRLNVEGA